MTGEMREKIERARHFALKLENRNYTGNLSAGFLAAEGEEIANMAQAFQALDELVTEIRALTHEAPYDVNVIYNVDGTETVEESTDE